MKHILLHISGSWLIRVRLFHSWAECQKSELSWLYPKVAKKDKNGLLGKIWPPEKNRVEPAQPKFWKNIGFIPLNSWAGSTRFFGKNLILSQSLFLIRYTNFFLPIFDEQDRFLRNMFHYQYPFLAPLSTRKTDFWSGRSTRKPGFYKSLRNCPNRCQRGSNLKAQWRNWPNSRLSFWQFLFPGMLHSPKKLVLARLGLLRLDSPITQARPQHVDFSLN